jgi:hypothetical protein
MIDLINTLLRVNSLNELRNGLRAYRHVIRSELIGRLHADFVHIERISFSRIPSGFAKFVAKMNRLDTKLHVLCIYS